MKMITESQAIDKIVMIVEDRKMKPRAIKVYIALVTMIRNGMDVIKRKEIEELTGLTGRSITKAIAELKAAGYIQAKQTLHGQKYILTK